MPYYLIIILQYILPHKSRALSSIYYYELLSTYLPLQDYCLCMHTKTESTVHGSFHWKLALDQQHWNIFDLQSWISKPNLHLWVLSYQLSVNHKHISGDLKIISLSGVTRLLLMPGQRLGKPPTHAAHIHMSIFIWTSVFFSKYVVLAILYARYLS